MHTFEFTNISFSVELSKPGELCGGKVNEKVILNQVSGSARAGTILAILGPSGSGKTCLLNILSGRISCGRSMKPNLTGQISFDGKPVQLADIRKQSAFVSQDDCLFSYLTVEETLLLSANFNLPEDSTNEALNTVVDQNLQKYGLEKVRATIIGSSTQRGISGGERKRVAIAKELLSDPLILFMDEPTSGLDSFQALSVVETFRILAATGKIILTVVHQPRSSIFFLFDNLLLLSEGKVMYFGAIDQCTDYFSRLSYACPTQFNPADFVMDIVSVDSRTEELRQESERRIEFLGERWLETEQVPQSQTKQSLLEPRQLVESVDDTEEKDASSREPLLKRQPISPYEANLSLPLPVTVVKSLCRHVQDFKILAWRSCAQLFRNRFGVGVRILTLIFFAVILSLIYQRLGYNQSNIQDRIGIIFFVTSNQVSRNIIITIFIESNVYVIMERCILFSRSVLSSML